MLLKCQSADDLGKAAVQSFVSFFVLHVTYDLGKTTLQSNTQFIPLAIM